MHVKIDFGGLDFIVPEHLLDLIDTRTAFQKVLGIGVSQLVSSPIDPGSSDGRRHVIGNCPGTQWSVGALMA